MPTDSKIVNAYLKHHGIKGQKWGVRRGPPYPIEDTVMAKGTKLNTVTPYNPYLGTTAFSIAAKQNRPVYTYNANDPWDNKVYKGPFSMYLVRDRGAQAVAEFRMETVKDLKMPTRAQRVQEFQDLYNDKKYGKVLKTQLEQIQRAAVKYNLDGRGEEYAKLDVRNVDWSNKEQRETAYAIFNHAMEAAHAGVATREYMRRMSSKYDAMVDDNNVNIYNEAHDPVIIFRVNEAVKVLDAELLKVDEVKRNYEEVGDELAKRGKRRSL